VIVGVAGGDRPAALQLIGVLAAIAGVVLVSREPEAEEERRRATRSSIVLAGVAAVGFGAFAVGIRETAQADVLWSVVAARGTSVVVLAVAFVIAGAKRERAASAWVPLVVMGTVDLGANILYAIATRHGLLSLVAVGASLYPLATVTLARTLLGERVRRSQEVGILAAVAGIALIAAG
jgi:drug/metabolite transporter (DMT)-like permease